MRCEKNDRAGPGSSLPKMVRVEVRGNGKGFPKRFGLVRGTTPKPPAPGVSNYPLRSGRSGSGNHQPISLSARSRVVIVPSVHCAPIVIGYQRYFCLNCRTAGRSPTKGCAAKFWRCSVLVVKTTNSVDRDRTIKTLAINVTHLSFDVHVKKLQSCKVMMNARYYTRQSV